MASCYARRRAALMAQMQSGVAILAAASLRVRNADTHYPYRQQSDFWYLTGFPEPEAWLVLDATNQRSILFCQEKNPEREQWDGFRYGAELARTAFGFDEAFEVAELEQRLPQLLADQPRIFCRLYTDERVDMRIETALNAARAHVRRGGSVPHALHDIEPLLSEMRLHKDADELALMRHAAQISAAGHIRAMQYCAPNQYEYQLEAELVYAFTQAGARAVAYPSIVAGGERACTLHYVENNQLLRDGDLVLIDAGCEFQTYAADITRTFPVNGRFSAAQKDVYEIVLAAQQAAITTIQPRVLRQQAETAALRVLVQGLVDLKILHGSVDGNIESAAYKPFYMHGIGHWLGLDVHDVGAYKIDGVSRAWEVGMVTTIEPGLYLQQNGAVPEALVGIGVRIEDNILVTVDGHENLTAAVPSDVATLETLIGTKMAR